MNPEEKIKKLIDESKISTDTQTEEKILGEAFERLDKLQSQKSVSIRLDIWRIIMKSQLTKIAAAAMVIIVCIVGLLLIDTTSSIALGDVLQKIEQVKAYKYQYNTNSVDSFISENDIPLDTNYETHQIILFSQEHGVKITTERINKKKDKTTLLEVYWLPQKKTLVSLIHNEKSYKHLEIDDAQYERMMEESYNPHKMVTEILNCKFESLGRSTIDGIEVEGFHTNDPNYMNTGTLIKPYDVKLWIDTKTILPVKIEINHALENDRGMHKTEIIIDKFQWDVTVQASEFEPEIPDGYALIPNKTVNEDTAIQSLEFLAELTGNYPEDLDPEKITSKILENLMRNIIPDANLQEQKRDEELVMKKLEEMKQTFLKSPGSIAGAGMFYFLLNTQDKDPAYYGDIVAPGDADNVLMRWKISDNDYRVIFGDLKLETVTKERLVELENKLPK